MQTLVAAVGETGSGRTGGEQYDARLLVTAKEAGFDVSYITWQGSTLDKLMGLPLLWRLRFITRTLSLTWQLYRSSGDVFIDVWLAPYVSFWAKHTSRKIILMVHHLRGELENNSNVQEAETVLIQAAAEILTVSQSSRLKVRALCEADIEVKIIPPGFVRLQVQRIAHETNGVVQLLFVGHITKAKGVLDLLQALALLSKNKAWFLHVVGGASEMETWEQVQGLITKYNFSSQVTVHGRVIDARLQELYCQSDVFVLPSHWEGYGIVFLEAMSLGLPIISTTAGAISEVVEHQQSGLLVEAGDIQSLSDAIEILIDSSEIRKEMAEYAYQAAKRAPDWDEIESRFLVWWQERMKDAC